MKYEIVGGDMQTLRVRLSKGDKFYANPGHFITKEGSVEMNSRVASETLGGMSRAFAGTGVFLAEFSANADGEVALSGSLPGKIMAFELEHGEELVVEHFAYLASDVGSVDVETVSLGAAFFGGASLFLQKHKGPGRVFVHVVGGPVEVILDGKEGVQAEPSHIAAFQPSLVYNVKYVGHLKASVLGGAGLFFANFNGRGKLICHSASRFALVAGAGKK